MSGFFDDVEELDDEGGFQSGGGFEPIPSGTNLLVIAEEAMWDEWEGERFVKVTWTVLAPSAFKNRKVFQKIKVFDKDSKKAKKARTMLMAIDGFCGGMLKKYGKEPQDQHLMKALLGKQIVIKVDVWQIKNKETDAVEKEGNWVCAVSAKKKVEEVKASKNDDPFADSPMNATPVDDDLPF